MNQYKDTRGLLISPDTINKLFKSSGTAENAMLEYIGGDRAAIDGYVPALLSLMVSLQDYYVGNNHDKPVVVILDQEVIAVCRE